MTAPRIVMGVSGAVGVFLLSGCAGTAPTAPPVAVVQETGCYSDQPLDQRLSTIRASLDQAFANVPPLSEAEHKEMSRLAACYGVAVLGVGDGCPDAWARATTSGLAERNRISGARYSIPEWMIDAQNSPDRSGRIRYLTAALTFATEAHEVNAVRLTQGKIEKDAHDRTATALNIIEGTLEDTIACESLR